MVLWASDLCIAPGVYDDNTVVFIACVSGQHCVAIDNRYSQCQVEEVTTGSSPVTPVTNADSTDFVKTSGQQFILNGSRFTVVGSNSYWVGLTGLNTTDMNKAFTDIAKTGATVVRGFNEVTTASPGIPYYQSWSGSTPTVNTGSDGLRNFDNVVAAARANGIRLIVALTNNWADYGGMDVYVNQIVGNGQPHHLFYTNENVIAAYKDYISAFVGRYKNEPTIMAWELATITKWASDISAYIKSIDVNHLVALGDEGFFNRPQNIFASWPYRGGDGIDFDANLQISTLDFGTVHSYPITWAQIFNPASWGTKWIQDHAASQQAADKPVILEEFGITFSQSSIYATWLETVISSGLTGDLIWQSGSNLNDGQRTPDDGYTIYPDGPVYPIITSHAAALKARD
ncbi:hypothetical protein VNI00_016916 [Paramarasmius palmivorus]|uniref:mannan endo-1,4-beta-mannosidase n=1 Tax=Paramarasmius palmivorus TaxID=297713 RepID=A0AAW0BAY0_9AGAR